jgi:ribose transport system permease protein
MAQAVEPRRGRKRARSVNLATVRRIGPYGVLLCWAIALVSFSIASPDIFATRQNLRAVASDQSVLAIAALGVTVPLVCGQFDLSVGAVISITGVISTGLMSFHDAPWVVALLAGVALGAAIGLANGLLIAYGQIHSFIATLGTSTLIGGVLLWYTSGTIIFENISPSFVNVMRKSVLAVPLPVFYMLAALALVWLLLTQTPFGRYLYAIGGNREAAEVAGVRVRRHIVFSMVASGTLAGIAGVMLASRAASAQSSAGDTFLLPAFAAAFIGSATLRRAEFNALGTVIGVYFLATLTSGAFIIGAADYVSQLITGSALLVAVLLNRGLSTRG